MKFSLLLKYFISGLVLVLISWIHYFKTGSILVDNNAIHPLSLNLFLASICIATILFQAKWTYNLVLESNVYSTFELRRLFYPLIIVSSAMLPLFTNDFFSFIGYADVSMQGCLVYENPSCSLQSVFIKYISPMYQNVACKYGPLNLFIAQFSYKMGGMNVLFCYFWYKLILLIFGILYIEIALLYKKLHHENVAYKLILFTPIWWLQGVGQGHNDFFAIVIILFGIYLLLRNKIWWASLFFALAVYFKYTYILLLILPTIYVLYETKKLFTLKSISISFFNILMYIVVAWIVYTPFVSEYNAIIASFKVMSTGGPSSTFSDIFSFIALLFNDNFEQNYSLIIPIFQALGLVLILFMGIRFLYYHNYKKLDGIFHLILCVFILMIFAYSHRFLPWYLMLVPILIALISKRKDWIIYLLVMYVLSTFQDISVMISTGHIIGQILMVASTVILVFFNFYKIKARFLE